MDISSHKLHADVVIIGGGLGGVAAALRVCAHQKSVIIVEPTAWIGGQATSQGVSALDEHRYIESFGGTPEYMQWRQRIRSYMASLHDIVPQDWASFNPGNAWVSNLCFYPNAAVTALNDMLATYTATGQCTVLLHATPVQMIRNHTTIDEIQISQSGQTIMLNAPYIIDASELGDCLSMANLTYSIGAESQADTHEHRAPIIAKPTEIQGFTYCFAVSYHPGQSHIIAKPEGYAQLRDQQPFTLTLTSDAGEPRPFRVFTDGPTGLPPFWTYRRLWDGAHSASAQRDVAMINWNSNDYHHGAIIDVPEDIVAARLDEAKRLSLAFLYWMQTEMPRDDGGYGYPELCLMHDIMGTSDGLSMAPYIRESRRTKGLTRILAHDLLAEFIPTARAKCYEDAVGIGWYYMDLHPAPGNPKSMFAPTRPFQIPLGTLIPPDCTNLVMGNKNIATTHLSNGSYRLHPVEWNIGAVAGELCAFALDSNHNPHDIWHHKAILHAFQKRLLSQLFPLAWSVDVASDHACFAVTQYLLVRGILTDDSWRAQQLTIDCGQPLTDQEWHLLNQILATEHLQIDALMRSAAWHDICMHLHPMLFGNTA